MLKDFLLPIMMNEKAADAFTFMVVVIMAGLGWISYNLSRIGKR